MSDAVESVRISPARERALLKDFFETVQFDKLPPGLPDIEDEDDDED